VPTPAAGRRPFKAHRDSFLEDLQARNYAPSTIRTNHLVLGLLSRYLRAHRVRDVCSVDEEHLVGFARYLSSYETRFRTPMSVATQSLYLGIVRGFFAWLDARNVILRNPAADLALPEVTNLPRGVLSEAQARRLMSAPSPWTPWGLRDRAILETLYGTGIRLRECLTLRLSDLALAERMLLVRNGKGRKDRVVPVPGRAAAAMDLYLRDGRPQLMRDSRVPEIFLSFRGRPLSQSALGLALRGYGRAAKIPGPVSPHVLRHTCATHLLQGGADIRHVQVLLGHKNLDTTAIYTRVAVKDLRAVLERAHPRNEAGKDKGRR
jgi:integrase/recombinase XerD